MTINLLNEYDVICFSHLRWSFVYQRPQHLLSRFSKYSRVFFIEEPVYDAESNHYTLEQQDRSNIWIFTPHLRPGTIPADLLRAMLKKLLKAMHIKQYIAWYYSPMALTFTGELFPSLIVYDCMDELSAFRFAPAALKQYESILFDKADIVFTGGHHLYKAK